MAAEPEKKQNENEEPQKKEGDSKKSSNRMVFFAILGVVILCNAIIAVILVRATSPKPEKEVEATHGEDSAEVEKEEVGKLAFSEAPIEAVVNIRGTDGMRFLKIVIVLGYDEEKYKGFSEPLAEHSPEIKNILIDRLATRSLEDLQRPNVRDELRAELKRLINKSLPKGKNHKEIGQIADVFINDFIIQ